MEDRRGLIRDECDRKGISGVHGLLAEHADIQFRSWIIEWIDEYERKESADRDAEQRELARLSVEAAQLSARTSQEAAEASKVSARWTMIAAVVAAVSTLVSATTLFMKV